MNAGEKWAVIYDFLKISEADIVVGVLKRGLKDTKTLDAVKKEIAKCQLLCSNCHMKHHYYNGNGKVVKSTKK